MRFAFSILAVLFLIQTASAAVVVPSADDSRFGWSRGDVNTFYSGWDTFVDEDGTAGGFFLDTTPDLTLAGLTAAPGGFASINETSGGTIPVGSGNIYSPFATLTFAVNVPSYDLGDGFLTRIVAQFRTQATPLDYSSITLGGQAASYTEIISSEVSSGPFGDSTTVEYLASWDLPTTATDYTLAFNASETSLSLDQLHIDGSVAAIPEPAAVLWFVAIAGGAAFCRLRKKSQFVKASVG